MQDSVTINCNNHKTCDNQVQFALINVQGLITKRLNKLQSSELKRVFDTNDIICITESWGDESQNFDYDGFEHFELHRTENKVTWSPAPETRVELLYISVIISLTMTYL